MIKRSRTALIFLFITLVANGVTADHHEKVKLSDLSWMTGSWTGPVGPGLTLEENWIQPVDGSLAAQVIYAGYRCCANQSSSLSSDIFSNNGVER